MASARLAKHHRRSHSASTSSPTPRRSPEDSWRVATKRAYPQPLRSTSPDLSSPQKWDVDLWRRGKRRRRNGSSESDSMDVDFSRAPFHSSPTSTAPPPTPAFAATSAEFHLFPKTIRTTDRTRRATHHAESALDTEFNTLDPRMASMDDSRTADLRRLRSDAYRQLSRSVEENGEGFVKSMRLFESSRSRSNAYMKVKEAQRRGRKRSPVNRQSSRNRDDSDDDDDVQIFAGEQTNTIFMSNSSRGKQRAFSVGIVEEKPGFTRSERWSSPGATCHSPRSSVYLSDEDGFHVPASNPQISPPALSHTLSHSANSSLVSLTLPPPFAPTPSLASSRSEKAIAALSLAMANGAGGIDDYEALRSLHTFSPDNCAAGEMWH